MMRNRLSKQAGLLFLALFLALTTYGPVRAQEEMQADQTVLSEEAYLTPPPEIADLALAPWYKNESRSNLSPGGRYFVETVSDGLPSVERFAKKFYRLGGEQIDPVANRDRRFTLRNDAGIDIIERASGKRYPVQVPRGARVSNPTWSPDGNRLAFYVHEPEETHIWVVDASTGKGRQVTRTPVLNTLMSSIEWSADGTQIMAVLVPEKRGEEPKESAVPTHPLVRMTEKGENKLRVYASLLESPHDMALLEYYTTGQLALVNVSNRRETKVGEPAMYQRVDLSPDGGYFRVTQMVKPFSYIVPVSNFGNKEEIWDMTGKNLTELESRELRTGIQGAGGGGGGGRGGAGGGANGKRGLTWRPDGAGLSYLELEPRPRRAEGEEPEEPVEPAAGEEAPERMDRVMLWTAPFDSTSTTVVYQQKDRMTSVAYSDDCRVLFITERSGTNEKLSAVYLDDPESKYTIYEHKTSDFFKAPGSLQMKRESKGGSVVRISTDGSTVYLSGTQYFEENEENAPRPFIDRVVIKTGETTRAWQSGEDVYERIVDILDDDLDQMTISRESPTTVADTYLLDVATGQAQKLTNNVDYAPEITQAPKRRFQVTRVDGMKFWVEVTLPQGYTEGNRLPAMFWFYPSEYTSQKDYDDGNRRFNKNSFQRLGTRSMQYLLKEGYVFVEPDCPIFGEEGRMNDNYIVDLRNDLTAVIDALDKMQIIDRERLAIGGHSYGAFSTANAMIHTPYFKAGIAGDGNYNRLLTPIGFQTERRELWEGRELYESMSPILYANQLNGALLMYHGMDDQNVGTAPFHAPKMFHALNGLGKTAALYMYPFEDHGPAARETQLDLWARWVAWLDTYVKNAGKEAPKKRSRGR